MELIKPLPGSLRRWRLITQYPTESYLELTQNPRIAGADYDLTTAHGCGSIDDIPSSRAGTWHKSWTRWKLKRTGSDRYKVG